MTLTVQFLPPKYEYYYHTITSLQTVSALWIDAIKKYYFCWVFCENLSTKVMKHPYYSNHIMYNEINDGTSLM